MNHVKKCLPSSAKKKKIKKWCRIISVNYSLMTLNWRIWEEKKSPCLAHNDLLVEINVKVNRMGRPKELVMYEAVCGMWYLHIDWLVIMQCELNIIGHVSLRKWTMRATTCWTLFRFCPHEWLLFFGLTEKGLNSKFFWNVRWNKKKIWSKVMRKRLRWW